MAFADLGSLGATGSSGNNQASLALTLGATGVAIGELVVIVVADDNIGTGADADGAEVASVADSGSNTWVKAKGWTLTTGGAQNGASVSLWWTVAKTAIAATTGTITATFTNNTLSDATAMTARHFSFVGRVAVENTNASTQTAGTDPNSLDAVTANIACLRIRGFACEVGNNTNLTPTANWVAWANGNSATTGTTAEMVARAEHHISTGTGDASDPSYAITADYAHVYVAFREQIPYPLDWPNPQHRLAAAAHIALRAEPEVNQLSLALTYVAPAVAYTPRAPLILEGWAAPRAVSLRTWLQSPFPAEPVTPPDTTHTTRAPVFLRGWPAPSSISLLTWIDQTKRHLIGQDSFFDGQGRAPVYDWPNPPLGKAYPSDLRTFIGFPSRALLTPIGRTTDWANPKAPIYPVSLRSHLQSINIPLSQTMGAINYNWPNPKGALANLRDIPQALLQTTLGVPSVPPVPFVQTDWPNPVQPIARLRGDVQPENRALFEPVISYTFRQPVVQFSWVRQVQHPQPPNLLGTTLGGPVAPPFIPFDWPNPQRHGPRTAPLHFRPKPGEDAVVSVNPFIPVFWPNPGRVRDAFRAQVQPHRVAFEGLDTFFGEPGQVPTQQFPNPRGPQYPVALRTWIDPYKRFPLPAPPFAQTDWPDPKGPIYPVSLRTHVESTKLNLIGKDAFFYGAGRGPVYDYPNPRGPQFPSDLRTFVQTLPVQTYVTPVQGYNTYDWPNPKGPLFSIGLYTHVDQSRILTYVPPEPVVIPPIPPVDELGGTTSRGGGTRRHHPAFTKKEYYKLIEQWAREAAAKTAEIVDTEKKVVPTKKSVIAATRRATIAESERLQTIWAETAARIAEIEAIDSKYQKMAADLAAHFGRLAADLEDEDEIIALLLS